MEKIPENQIIMLKAFLPFLVIIFLFFIVGQFGFGKISDIQTQIQTAQTQANILNQKIQTLNNISQNGAKLSNVASNAMPDSNPDLAVIGQLQLLASTSGLGITQLKAGSPGVDASGLSDVEITFDLSGPWPGIESFLKGISTIAPITLIDKIKISEQSVNSSNDIISVKSFWAPYPKKVPAVTEAIQGLTPSEQQILQTVSALTQPASINLPAVSNGGRSDPFNP